MKTLLRTSTALSIIAVILYFTFPAAAQSTTSKLVIKKKEVYIVGPGNILRVDTLIMQDKATIQFDPTRYGILEAKLAIIGKKCVVSSKGVDGKKGENLNPGEDGTHGGSLSIMLNFESLGKLTIDTRGGNGGAGVNGRNGQTGTQSRVETKTVTDASGKQQTITIVVPAQPGSNGTDATMGGNGGNGGNVMMMYATNGFIPIFNQETRDKHGITILHTGGQRGRTGEPGRGGIASMDGTVRYTEIKGSTDGRVDLINLNSKAH